MVKKESLETIKEVINKCFAEKKEIKAVYLYGSIVSGRDNVDSDVDIALLTDPYKDSMESHKAKVRYEIDLAMYISRSIDIVFLQEAGELLAFQIIKEGIIILERDKEASCSFRATRLIQCLDFQFLEKRMQSGMIAAMRREGIGK